MTSDEFAVVLSVAFKKDNNFMLILLEIILFYSIIEMKCEQIE